jgi:hypothetical protein
MKPPEQKETRPGGIPPETGCLRKRPLDSTPPHQLQGVTDPLLAIAALWMRLGASARREFLADVRTVHADLWDYMDGNSYGGPAT